MTDIAPQKTSEPTTKPEKTIESEVELAKKAFAFRKYEDAVEHYATALELMTAKHGDGAPESADLLFLYGKALFENAVAQADVFKKEQADGTVKEEKQDAAPSGSGKKGKGPLIEFGGDAEDEEDDKPVDMFAEAKAAADAADEDGDEDGEDGGEDDGEEPEDDFNAAWEVLDLARALYAKAEGDDAKLKLADTYIALGDVSLETEKFDQASTDYTAGLHQKQKILPIHSRQIAEVHYKLALALDLTPGKLAGAVEHAEKAVQSVDVRLELLRAALAKAPADEDIKMEDAAAQTKGKGKTSGMLGSLLNDSLDGLKKDQIEAQIKEFEELKEDLNAKVEDLRTVPEEITDSNGEVTSATDAANKALDEMLNAGVNLAEPTGVVNDLSAMVRKKKKAPPTPTALLEVETNANGKRKAEDDEMEVGGTTPVEKRVKLADDEPASA